MARRIFLHIGVMKSATSYLQGLCEQNQEQLAEAGLFWCPGELRYQAVKEVLGRTPATGHPVVGWTPLVRQLRRHAGDALISNELLAGLGGGGARRLVRALPKAEVQVIITARDLARIIPSHWQTTVKNGRTWTWSQFASSVCTDTEDGRALAADPADSDGGGEAGDDADTDPDPYRWFWRRHDLPAIVQRWARVVPVERITIVTVPSDASEMKTVAARFGSVLDVDLTALGKPDVSRNPSLGAHSVELLRRLNQPMTRRELDDPEHRFERAVGGALAARAHLEPPFALTLAQHSWVRQRVTAMVEGVERLGPTVVGDLAELLPDESPPQGAVDPGDTSDADLLAAAMRGLMGLSPTFNRLRAERYDLRRRLSALELKIDTYDIQVRRQRGRIQTLLAERPAARRTPRRLVAQVRSRLRRSSR